MKKILIGCGVVLLLVVGGLGYVAYVLAGDVKAVMVAIDRATSELERLDERYAYDERTATLDTQGFLRMLDVREVLAERMQEVGTELEAYAGAAADDGPGLLDMAKWVLRTAPDLLGSFTRALEAERMGPTEFGAYTRIMWIALRRIDASADDVSTLRGLYGDHKELYERETDRNYPDALPFDELLGDAPHPVVEAATEILRAHADRVREVLRYTTLDPFFMLMPIEASDEPHIVFLPDAPGTRRIEGPPEPEDELR